MAYRADVTQNLQPASADPGTAANAIATKGKALAGAVGALGGTLWEAYQGKVAADNVADLEATKNEFFQLQEREQLIKANSGVANTQQTMGTMFEQGNWEGLNAQQQQLDKFKSEAARLKQVVDSGGLSIGSYVGRVQASAKKWIATFPGMAAEIRKEVATLTGISNADFATEETILNEKMGAAQALAKQQQEQEKLTIELRKKDADLLVKSGMVKSHEEAYRGLQTGSYQGELQVAQNIEQANNINASILKDLEVKAKTGEYTADKAGPMYMSMAMVGAANTIQKSYTTFKPVVDKLMTMRNADGTWDMTALNNAQASLAGPINEIAAAVTTSFNSVIDTMRKQMTDQGTPGSQIAKQVDMLVKQRDDYLKSLSSGDMQVAATTLKQLFELKKGDFATRLQSLDVGIKMLAQAGTSPYAQMFVNNPEQMKKMYPDMYAVMSQGQAGIVGDYNRAMGLLNGAGSSQIGQVATQVATTGQMPAVDPSKGSEARAVVDVCRAACKNSIEYLSRGDLDSAGGEAGVNNIAAGIDASIKARGPALKDVAGMLPQLQKAMANMPEPMRAAFKDKVLTSVQTSMVADGSDVTAPNTITYKIATEIKALEDNYIKGTKGELRTKPNGTIYYHVKTPDGQEGEAKFRPYASEGLLKAIEELNGVAAVASVALEKPLAETSKMYADLFAGHRTAGATPAMRPTKPGSDLTPEDKALAPRQVAIPSNFDAKLEGYLRTIQKLDPTFNIERTREIYKNMEPAEKAAFLKKAGEQ